MQEDRLKTLLENVSNGSTSIEDAIADLKHMPFEDLGYAKVDHHRQLRQGLAEVIYAPGKTAVQVAGIASKLKTHNDVVIATRASAEQAERVRGIEKSARYFELEQCIVWGDFPEADPTLGKVLVISAGTSDMSVASEAKLILRANAVPTDTIADIGVAGIHRLTQSLPQIREAKVCIVVAGMDGVLPSVIGGLVESPVIACPTSAGYGASFGGLAALLTMLNSCAAGLTVVNIDNGFGAAVAAIRILKAMK